MVATTRYRASAHPPADLRGRPRGDRMLSLLGTVLERTYLAYIERTQYDSRYAGSSADTALTVTLLERRVVAQDDNVVALTFGAGDGGVLPSWQPGCHVDFHLPSGLRRQYSLCGDARANTYTVAVRHIPDGGGGSTEMHGLRVGDSVTVRGPRNGFPYAPTSSMLFVAGGIGITPIVPMVRHARENGIDWRLVYSGRSRESMPFLDEIEGWGSDRVTIRTDDADGLPTAHDLLGAAEPGSSVYCCGPTPMLDTVRAGFGETDAAALHFERFGEPPVVDGQQFQVQLASTGAVLDVPADRSALSVIAESIPSVAYSCKQGFCGTCKVRVLAGTPEHRENRLTPDEQADHMLICVSRAAESTRVIVDV